MTDYQKQNITQDQARLPKSAMAITSFVLGIIALFTSFLPIINNLSFFLALLALIFGIIGFVGIKRGKKSGKGIAIAALVISILSCVIVLATQSMYSDAIDEATNPTIAEESSDETADASDASDSDAEEADYTIGDETLVTSGYYPAITGTFTNNTDDELTSVSLTYNLYDEDGNLIGNAYASASNIQAGSSWSFEATVYEDIDAVASFERSDVSAW